MRKLGLIMTPAFMLAMALAAAAQEKPLTTKKENDATVKVNVSGRFELDYVWRSGEMELFVDTISNTDVESENTFEGFAAIRFDVELSDKVSLVLEIGTERVDNGIVNTWAGASNNPSLDVVIREAHILLSDFLTPALSAQIGIETWAFDVRGKGSAFAFDPRHSQSFTRNLSTVADGTIGSNAPENLQPVGGVLSYVRDALTFELILLPAVIEAGPASQDEALYAADFWYRLDTKGSRVGAILAVVSFEEDVALNGPGGGNTAVMTLGGGATLKGFVEGLELFGEVYFQFGDAGKNQVDGDELDAGGMALQVGAEFTLQMGLKLGGSITMISGDDDTVGTNDDVDTFLSYENMNDLMIIEDMYFGFDWDSNYFAFKGWGEYPLSVGGGKDNLILSAIFGITRTNEDVEFVGGGEDALGNEFDVKARWLLNKQVSFHAGAAILVGSDVLENSFPGGSSGPDADDSATLFVIGTDVLF